MAFRFSELLGYSGNILGPLQQPLQTPGYTHFTYTATHDTNRHTHTQSSRDLLAGGDTENPAVDHGPGGTQKPWPSTAFFTLHCLQEHTLPATHTQARVPPARGRTQEHTSHPLRKQGPSQHMCAAHLHTLHGLKDTDPHRLCEHLDPTQTHRCANPHKPPTCTWVPQNSLLQLIPLTTVSPRTTRLPLTSV